ncbi:LPS export ABC transporter periplasmic protein LptC [Arachidicoccus terrestris]|uniref:LPS export ABC transporter periplasmic protein LptC n=1 Tax=Arachidicoccus terrestris TaxID=2875539 RepID=UPI001CC545F4|nr:LPS export ABC transporter periplasmic protein LptC [Arachidicoccus terrestris]UAY56457.1 LPS export ABC transporter periplasmic protein LptC [Arachidicoccus terrestris]
MPTFTSKYLRKSCCLLLAGSLLLGGCENDINEVKALNNHGYNTEEATGVTSYLSIGGKVKAKLTAPVMISSEKDTTSMSFPNSLFVVFYDDSTSLPSSFVSAKYGIYYKRLNKVKLKDSVVAYTIAGDTLTTSELWWDQNTETIYSDKPSVLKQTHPYGLIPGDNGFHAKQDFSEFVFLNANDAILEVENSISSGSNDSSAPPVTAGTDTTTEARDTTAPAKENTPKPADSAHKP